MFDFRPESAVMHEIGRLREVSFRQVGEGTGARRDLDRYDRHYRHIVLWDEHELEIIGAYRLGEIKQLLSDFSTPKSYQLGEIKKPKYSLYSQELFTYDDDKMSIYFDQGIELGRSFVSPKYWGKRSLDYLWYGIGAYLKKHPEIRYLIGPVSISNNYPDLAKALLVGFYQHYFFDSEQLAEAHTPYRLEGEERDIANRIVTGLDYTADFAAMREQLTHLNVSVPTLYKQYADLCESGGVRFIDFNIDADFGHCIDGLVMVDLQLLKTSKRKRYLGI